MFLDLPHKIDLLLTLQLHLLYKVVLELTRIERGGCGRQMLILSFRREGSSLSLIMRFILRCGNLLYHNCHEILIWVHYQVLAETQVIF